jgi:hypothetical protein
MSASESQRAPAQQPAAGQASPLLVVVTVVMVVQQSIGACRDDPSGHAFSVSTLSPTAVQRLSPEVLAEKPVWPGPALLHSL